MFVSMCFCLTHFCTIFLLVFSCVYFFLHLLVFFLYFPFFRNIHGFVPAWDYFRTEASHWRRVLSPAGSTLRKITCLLSKISFKSGSHRQSWKRYGMVLKLFEKTRKWPDRHQNPENVTKKNRCPSKAATACAVSSTAGPIRAWSPGTISQASRGRSSPSILHMFWELAAQRDDQAGFGKNRPRPVGGCAIPSRDWGKVGPAYGPVGSLFWSCFGLSGRGPEWDSGPFRAFAFGNCCGPCSGPFRSLCFPVLFPVLCRPGPCFRPFVVPVPVSGVSGPFCLLVLRQRVRLCISLYFHPRVSSFYMFLSGFLSPSPPPFSPSPPSASDLNCKLRISVGTTASSRSQWALPDLNRKLQISAAGPQRAPDLSGHGQTSTAGGRSQWALPGPQPDARENVR